MNLKTIDALLWKCKSLGCEAPSITLEDNEGVVSIKQWECGEIPQPTPEEADAIDAEWKLTNDYLVGVFDAEKAIGREAQVFSGSELIRLAPVSYTINTLISYKNFFGGVSDGTPYAGLKQFLQGLVLTGAILQGDFDKLNGILKEQNIDLLITP